MHKITEKPVAIFDVFGTLFRLQENQKNPTAWRYLAEWFSYRDWHVTPENLQSLWETITQERLASATAQTMYPDVCAEEVLTEVLEKSCDKTPSEALIAEALLVFRQATTKISIYPQMTEVLHRVSKLARLAIASNTQRAFTDAELKKFKIYNFFECITYSSDLGRAKPDPAVIAHVLELMGASKENAIYIGDNPHDDVRAANELGIPVVLLSCRPRPSAVPEGIDLLPANQHVLQDTAEAIVAAIKKALIQLPGSKEKPKKEVILEALGLGDDPEMTKEVSRVITGGMRLFAPGHFARKPKKAAHDRHHMRDAVFVWCDFSDETFDKVHLDNSVFVECDFKRATFRHTSLRNTKFFQCDFYRTVLETRVSMSGAEFHRCSLNQIDMTGAHDFSFRTICRGLASEDRSTLQKFHNWGMVERKLAEKHIGNMFEETETQYRYFSAYMSDKGRLGDSSMFFLLARHAERQKFWHNRQWVKWIASRAAYEICEYGESLYQIAVCFMLALCVAFIGARWGLDLSRGLPIDQWDRALYAFADAWRILSSGQPVNYTPESPAQSVFVAIMNFLGIGLVGLFGFVLGRKIRDR